MKRLHPLSAVQRAVSAAVRGASTAFFAVIALSTVVDTVGFEWIFVLGPLGAISGLAYGVARYYRFAYEVADGRLTVASGVFDRQERDIPLGRIQNVDVRRGLFHRVAGLAVVNFETAGGSATEAVLNAVTVAEADRLQEAVARHRREAGDRRSDRRERSEAGSAGEAGDPDDGTAVDDGEAVSAEDAAAAARPERELLYELSTTDLLLFGFVSVRPGGPVLALFSTPFLEDVAWRAVETGVSLLGGPARLSFGLLPTLSPGELALVAGVAAVQFLIASWLLSAVLTVLSYYDFRLERVGDDLRYERGLVQRFSGSIPLEKVQTVAIRENALMRPLGYAGLSLETAGYAAGGNDGDASNTAVPFDDRETVVEFAERLGPVDCPEIERPPTRARRRYAARYGVLPVLLATALLFGIHRLVVPVPWWPLALIGLVAAPLVGHLSWRNRGHGVADDGVATRAGFWVRHTRLVPYFRVQTVIDVRTVFQRRRGLASVIADTASSAGLVGGDAVAHDLDDGTARDLHRTLRDRLAADLARRRRERQGGGRPGVPGRRLGDEAGETGAADGLDGDDPGATDHRDDGRGE
ncbi:PH domain-containing protein [Halomicrobium salinisoli]|uniref:PH domain-containing protein n=1 Tax=Halomicrobium salinisoli TaxID=2878391 RepID=UPI001CF070C3|nr:PH domain-containing protein [Halomicrobium salinisoli]